ncbi:hypothetical protein MTO96_008286 [Rhipicephalus appendiculatus]
MSALRALRGFSRGTTSSERVLAASRAARLLPETRLAAGKAAREAGGGGASLIPFRRRQSGTINTPRLIKVGPVAFLAR